MLDGGSGGNTFNVGFTPNLSGRAILTTINSGSGNDTVNVAATSGNGGASLAIQGQAGQDQVNVGDPGHNAQGIGGAVSVDNSAGSTALTLDDATDTAARSNNLRPTASTVGTPPAPATDASVVTGTLMLEAGSGTNHVTP